jgi:hypothetical protein
MIGKIDPTKQYRTRHGREWRFLEYCEQGTLMRGAFKLLDDSWKADRTWFSDGRYCVAYGHDFDLIEVRPRIQRKVWINVYKDETRPNFAAGFTSRELADEYARASRSECLEITLDYEEGEGL